MKTMKGIVVLGIALGGFFLLNKLFVQENTEPEIILETNSDALFELNSSTGKEGHGFFISSNGLALTSYHLIESASENLQAETFNGPKEAYVLQAYPQVDLALLQVEVTEPVPFLTFSKMSVKTGDRLFFLEEEVKVLDSQLEITGRTEEYVQTLFPLFSVQGNFELGQSGTPILDINGYVTGILTFAQKEEQSGAFLELKWLNLTIIEKSL